jgi:UDP-N-acetylmuramoyl-tripeptide--D-alanyl-D-alanine ligase
MAGSQRAPSRLCDTGEVSDTRPREPRPGTGWPALTASEVAATTGGRLVRDSARQIRGAAVDSRAVAAGNMFVALTGENTDGHLFLSAALAAGAAALLVREDALGTDSGLDAIWAAADAAVVAVPDTLAGLHAVAAAWRRRFDPLVVGVTGSIAKTSTKEAVAAVLSEGFATLRSEGNANNEIGLPLTILRMGPEHQAAVLEMGMYVGGEIAQLAAMARPRIGVVTAVREVHLSRIGSIEAVERAKAELVEALPPDGTAVLNLEDERVARMRDRTTAAVLTYGFSPSADVRAVDVASAGLDGMTFTLIVPGGSAEVATPALGRHGVHNGLAAAAVGVAAGLDLERIVTGLGRGWQAEHRDQLVRAGDLTILDDSYNASPASMLAALELLASLPGRHVAVLGEMLELGHAAESGHAEVGRVAAGRTDLLVVIGPGAVGIADAAARTGAATIHVPDREAALQVLFDRLRPGDTVLVKASRGAALDLIVAALVERFGGAGGGVRTQGGTRPAIEEAR